MLVPGTKSIAAVRAAWARKASPSRRTRQGFPDPNLAPADAPAAIGGDLAPERLLDAYANGLFPWFNDDRHPICWWSPDPRAVIAPDAVKVSRSLRKRLRRGDYAVTADKAFAEVIAGCAAPRRDEPGTWITANMQRAYATLHRAGFAHSVETWAPADHGAAESPRLVGGLYGISLGRMFFGESMFSVETDASKVAFATLAKQLAAWSFRLIDCQFMTDHLASLGAEPVPRRDFLELVRANNRTPTRRGAWHFNPMTWE